MTALAGPVRAALALVLAAVFAAPLVVLVLGSLRTPGLPPPGGFDLVPDAPRPANYETAAGLAGLAGRTLNSLLVCAVAVPVTVAVASWAGFAVATARRRTPLIVVTLAAFMVPPAALWVPRVVLLDRLGLTDHTLVLALPALAGTSPFYVLLFAFVYARVPRRLTDAAAVEGLSALKAWWLVFPLARPAAFAVAMLAFVAYWSALIEPQLLIPTEERRPVSEALWSLAALDPAMHPIFLAGAVLVTLPPVIVFLLAQRALLSRTLEV